MSSNLTRGLQTTIDETAIENGKIRFAVDTGRLYIDSEHDRIPITDVIYGLTYAEIVALEHPLPKVYLTSDSHQVMSYDYNEEEWIIYGGGYSPAMVVVDVYINDNGNLVLIYGDGNEKEVPLNTSTIIVNMQNEITQLQEKMTEFESAIELIKS